MRVRRRPEPPPGLAKVLERGERALVWARLVDGGCAVATSHALLLGAADEPAPVPAGDSAPAATGWRRLPWHRIASAGWDDDAGVLSVEEVGTRSAPAVQHRLRLAQASLLPETVRERVTASIVVSEHVALQGRAGARLVARRVESRDELAWQVHFDRGVDASDPAVRRRAEQALEDLRRATGA